MNKERAIELKVGIVTLAAIIIFIVGMILSSDMTVTDSQIVNFRFPNSGGVKQSSPVMVNGVKRGSVVSVKNDGPTVLISAEIDDLSDFKTDASARITILEITGGKKIDVFPGRSSDLFSPHNEITGTTPGDIAEVVAMFGEVADNAKNLIKSLDTITSVTAELLGDKNTTVQLRNIIANTNSTMARMNRFLANNLGDIDATVANLKTISEELKLSFSKNSPKIDSLIIKFDQTVDYTSGLLKSAESAISKSDLLLDDLNHISKAVSQGDGLANKLIYGKKFANNLDSTMIRLNELIEKLDEHGVNVNVRLGTRP